MESFAKRDLLTGLGLAGLLLPEAVAYAGMAGLAPGRAIAAAVAGALAYALTGRSRFAVIAPTSSSAAILGAALIGFSGEGIGSKDATATALVMMTGAGFAALALFRLGNLAGFISRPVLRGFALGLAITIIARQLPNLMGLHVTPAPLWRFLGEIVLALPQTNWPSLLLGLAALLALLLLRRAPRWPGALMVIAAGLVLGSLLDPAAWGVALVGEVALDWPDFALPPVSLLPRLAQIAAPIALILFAESWGTMRALALQNGDRVNANRELGALGLANLAAGLAQGMPVGAGFSAANANASAGAQSRWAAVTAALALLALALFAAPEIGRIPEPILAAVVIAALTHALNPAPILRLFHIRRDGWVAVAAVVGVLVLGVLNGMLAAIMLSIAMLLYDLSHPSISALGRVGDGHDYVDMARHDDAHAPQGIALFRPNAPLFFANAESVLNAIATRAGVSGAPVVVLSLEESNDLDATAIDALAEFVQDRESHGQRVVLARAHDRLRDVLIAAGMQRLAQDSTFSVADAVARVDPTWQDSEL